MVDDSDAVTVDSWGAHTTMTSTTIGTAMTIGLVPVIDFSDTDGGAPKKWRCPRHPDNIFDDRHATCPDCEKEFQLHRIELKERRASVQQKLLQVQSSFRREGLRLREVFLRPKRAGWIAGRRSGQRELYMHIPHADTLVEAARLARGAEEAPAE